MASVQVYFLTSLLCMVMTQSLNDKYILCIKLTMAIDGETEGGLLSSKSQLRL